MTYFAPCFNCAADKATCERRATMRKALKGTGITSAKFNCPDRQAKFRRGQRVAFDWRYYDSESGAYGTVEGYTATFVGTIMREKPGNRRFSIRVDQEDEAYDVKPHEVLQNPMFTSVRPDNIRALDEPDRAMCEQCAAYVGDDADISVRCERPADTRWVGCVKP